MVDFPTSLDSFTDPTGSNHLDSPDHATQHADKNDSIEALEAKVGADSSVVESSHDYKLSGVADGDKSVSLAGTEELSNKTLQGPLIYDSLGIEFADISGTLDLSEISGTLDLSEISGTDVKADVAQEAWHEVGAVGEPAFEHGWMNYNVAWNTMAFMKDSLGFVHLKGMVKGGTTDVVFTIPVGYRPINQELWLGRNSGNYVGYSWCANSDGSVGAYQTTGYVTYDGIIFKAEN